MRFRIFGIQTEVQLGFWFVAALLGLPLLNSPFKAGILVWIAAVFVSVMLHELGHALAIMRHRIEPEITLYSMGGLTSWSGAHRLSRGQRMFISFAGPLAGFLLAGFLWGTTKVFPELMFVSSEMTQAELLRVIGVDILIDINLYWGLINLVPVLPFDGGHILEQALGPRRVRTTAIVSLVAGALVAAFAFFTNRMWMGFIFAMSALQSFQRFQAEAPNAPAPRRAPEEPPLPAELAQELDRAKSALDEGRHEEAATLAELVLSKDPPRGARVAALHVLGWAHVLDGSLDAAARALHQVRRSGVAPDPALEGACSFARGDYDPARALFEAARAAGDDRKEIVGPLIQILIKKGEIARAAAIANDVADSLSDADLREMAQIALVPGAYGWSARLSEAVFERTTDPEDAVAAAGARALEGEVGPALRLLERAKKAGFADMSRIVGDAAFSALLGTDSARAALEALFAKGAE